MRSHMSTLLDSAKRSAREYLQPEVVAWAATTTAAVAAAVVTALMMVGCATGDGAQRAQVTSPEALASGQTLSSMPEGGTWPADAWWKAFGDAQLDALIDEALRGSPSLQLAQARLARANAAAVGAESSLLPQASLAASSERGKFTANYIYPPPLGGATYTTNELLLNLGWDIDFWGKNRALIDSAHASVKAASADRAAAQLALTTSIARSWFQLQRQYELSDVVKASIKQRESILDLTRQRVGAGLDTNVELRQAESQLPQARVDLAQIEESIALTRNQLAALTGAGPDRGITIGRPSAQLAPVAALPSALPAHLLGRRPDLVAARWRIESAQSSIDNARAQFYPDINLVASAGFISLGGFKLLSQPAENTAFGPALSLPIYQGELRANLRGTEASYDAAVAQYNQTLIDALHDVADQIRSLQALERQASEEDLALSKIEDGYSLAVQRYRAGLGNYLTVLTAESAVLQQRRAATDIHARQRDVSVSLVRALGGGFLDNSNTH